MMNAFDIFSMSSGLDLLGLFEGFREERAAVHGGSNGGSELIGERVSEIVAKLEYKVEKNKSGILGLMKEKTDLSAKMLELGYAGVPVGGVEISRWRGGNGGGEVRGIEIRARRYCFFMVRTVTREQVELIRDAVHDESETNARPIQPVNQRSVKLFGPEDQQEN
ncbi:hypothetical protein LguiB_001030 [Lonicera macranthoides]